MLFVCLLEIKVERGVSETGSALVLAMSTNIAAYSLYVAEFLAGLIRLVECD